MNWIVKMFQSAGSGSNDKDSVMAMPKRSHMLDALSEEGAIGALTVVAIRNGFLITRRTYNPNGPDRIEATYAANADDLGPQIIAELAQMRLTK